MGKTRVSRSKSGCLSCRRRKVKCDETRSTCRQCIKHRFSCEWPDLPSRMAPLSSLRNAQGRKIPSNSMTIQPALTDRHIPCANSLTLSSKDCLLINYFPSSTVYCYYDFFEWGALQYIVKVIAPRSKLVTRMILALSASEMHKHSLKKEFISMKFGSDEGLIHYTSGIQDLLEDVSRSDQGDLIDAKLAALIFMMHYEFHHTRSIYRVRVHLRGFWALINNESLFQKQFEDPSQSQSFLEDISNPHLVLSCQLIGWALYLDIAITTLGAPSSILKSVLESDNPSISPMRLCQLSRLGTHRLWRDHLPGKNMLTDAEFNRPIEFGWQVMLARFKISDLWPHGQQPTETILACSSILDHLMDLQERYCDILHIADQSSRNEWNTTLEIITRFACFYWASILFCQNICHGSGLHVNIHSVALSKTTDLLYYRYKHDKDPRKQSRVVWCMFVAAIETRDWLHRDWLVQRLKELRNVSLESSQLCSMAFDILQSKDNEAKFTFDIVDVM